MKRAGFADWSCWAVLLACVAFLGWVDWLTGFELNSFLFYFLPVTLAGWLLGLVPAVVFSVLCALVWFGADRLTGHIYATNIFAVWNTIIRLGAFLAIGVAAAKLHQLIISEREKSEALARSLSEIKVLESFLSICSQCKKIRNEDGKWQQMESYISAHSGTRFSHGYCPDCAKKLLEDAYQGKG